MCGEHNGYGGFLDLDLGSSPHVRGALHVEQHRVFPAWDHPRMCGEHLLNDGTLFLASGSSPHVRGAP